MCWFGCGSATCGRGLSSTSKDIGELRADIVATERVSADRRPGGHDGHHRRPPHPAAVPRPGRSRRRRRTPCRFAIGPRWPGNICNASPAADTAPVLLAHGATVNLIALIRAAPRAARMSFSSDPVERRSAPASSSRRSTCRSRRTRLARHLAAMTRRRGVDLATINLCCLVMESGEVRFAFGAVGPRPFVVEDDTGALAGASGRAPQDAALDRGYRACDPISDVRANRDYRVAMLR